MSYVTTLGRGMGSWPEYCVGPGVYYDSETGDCETAAVPECPNGKVVQTTDAQGTPVSPAYCVPYDTPASGGGGGGSSSTPGTSAALKKEQAAAEAYPEGPKLGAFGTGALIVLGVVVVGTVLLA